MAFSMLPAITAATLPRPTRDASQVLKELEEAKKENPQAHVRIMGFDNVPQVQCISFIAYRPPGSS